MRGPRRRWHSVALEVAELANIWGQLHAGRLPELIRRSSSGLAGSSAPAKLLHVHPLMALLAEYDSMAACCCGRCLACLRCCVLSTSPTRPCCAATRGCACDVKGLEQTTGCIAPRCPQHPQFLLTCCGSTALQQLHSLPMTRSPAHCCKYHVHARCTTSGHCFGHRG